MVWANNSGGSSVAYLNITVVDELPALSYNPNNLELTKNTQSGDFPLNPTVIGSGEITSWEINATLPDGLNFGTSNGTIWGIPTVLQTTAVAYTIWANNSGGSSVAYLNITVVDELPALSYNPNNLELTKNTQSGDFPLNPTVIGSGEITSWEINATLPDGLNFGTSNGTIWGIPTVLQTTAVAYTIWANNSGGSVTATINITINDQAPNISYSPDELNLTRATASSDLPLSPTNTGGNTQSAALSCSSSDKLFMVADQQGTRHILCGTTLYSIDLNGTQTVSSNIVTGVPFGLEIDDDGHLHIGHSVSGPNIHHSTNKNGSWQSSNVYSFSIGGSVSYDNQGFSMAVGSDGSIHFTYIRVTNAGNQDHLHYVSNQSGSWSSALLTSSGKPEAPSLTLNDDNVPHVAFTAGNSFSVGKYENGSYTTLLSRTNNVGPGIAIDAQGDVHVVYYNQGYNGLYYSTNASGSWQHTTLASTERHIDARIALDSNDYPHVMTVSIAGQYGQRHVNYYSHDGSSWSGGSITPVMSGYQRPDIFIDDNDVISTVYNDGSFANLFTRTSSTTYGYSISPALPSGLKFSQSTGTISGTATVQMNRTMFTITANNSGGSSTAYINITVNARMPSFTYSPENLTLTNNTVSSDLPLVPTVPNGADAPTEWVLIGTLPAGLDFGTNNGTIWGTPTELWSTTNYTVYGNNTGGSFNVSINITVNDQIPMVSYSTDDLSLTNNTLSNDLPLVPILSGSGEITSWAINATLPAGVQFGSDNGTFWGTPTELWNTTAYMIWANNSGGSSFTYLNITVVDELPTISYNPFTLNLTNNTVSADLPLAPSISGPGVITSWAINATLPTGIQFGTDNGTFWGVATQLWEEHSYIVWANNSGGSSFTTVNLSVVDQLPNLTYVIDKLELVNNTINMSMPLLPTLTGPGEITSWAINATLPAGIQFGPDNGTFWGVPTELWPETNYTVWANNSGGSTSTSILLLVVDQLPLLSYVVESIELTNDTSHDNMPLLAVLTGPGEITSWAISGELPTGLNFNESNGTIWGIATELWPETVYTIWANNSGGSSFVNLSITVLDQLPEFSYTSLEIIMQNNSELSLYPLSTGGNIANWSISPELSPGLYFDNGTLYGVATGVKNKTMYVINATNEIGSTTFNLNITVSELLYDTSYGERFEIRGREMQPYGPELSLDDAVYAINPMLPQGLFIGSDNGTIWGTPTQVFELTRFTIFSNSSSFNDTFVIYIQVLEDTDQDGEPDEVPDGVNPSLGLIEDVDDDGDGWTDEEEFTCGFTDSKDASSIPVDSDGDGICDFMEELVITYQGEDFEFIQGQTNISLMAFSSGMVVDTWEISPSLPEGMLFGSENHGGNGTIYGIPIYAYLFNTYTITATNSLTNFQATTKLNLSVIADFDLDGKSDNTSRLGFFEIDADDDNDGYEDAIELACDSDPYDRTSLPRVDDENNCITDDDISESSDEDNAQSGFGNFFVLAFLFILATISFILWRRKNRTGVRPEYVTSKPKFAKGDGFEFEPFKLKDAVVPYNGITESEEIIECSEMTPNTSVKFVDKNSDVNAGRFRAIISGGPRNGETKLRSNEYGVMSIKFTFDGSIRPEEDGAEYQAEIILDNETHFVWKVETEKRKWMTQESIEEDFDDIADKTPEESEDDDSEIESEDESKKKSKKSSKKKSKKEIKKESEDKSEDKSEKSRNEKAEDEQDSDKEKASDTDEDSETKSDEGSDEGSEDESKKSSKKGSKKKSEKESKKPSSKDKTEKSSDKSQDEKAEGEEDSDEEKSSDTDDDSETKSDEESDEGPEDESEEESEKETSEDESETEPSDKSEKESSDDKTKKSSKKSPKKKAKDEDGDSNKKKTSGSKKQSESKAEKKPKQNKKKSSKSKN